MKGIEQFSGMSVLDHGRDVYARYLDLISDKPLLKWRMPEWVEKLKPLQLPVEIMKDYLIYHDCGKPFCRTIDEAGKQHFPDHAQKSYETWMQYAETEQDRQIGKLIQMDMDAHTIKGDAIDDFIKRPEAPSLLLAGLAEIHSNAQWLQQLDSDQFKIKWKRIDKIGRRLVANL
jgi:hypothetical protein